MESPRDRRRRCCRTSQSRPWLGAPCATASTRSQPKLRAEPGSHAQPSPCWLRRPCRRKQPPPRKTCEGRERAAPSRPGARWPCTTPAQRADRAPSGEPRARRPAAGDLPAGDPGHSPGCRPTLRGRALTRESVRGAMATACYGRGSAPGAHRELRQHGGDSQVGVALGDRLPRARTSPEVSTGGSRWLRAGDSRAGALPRRVQGRSRGPARGTSLLTEVSQSKRPAMP